jgi:hypothetical protein
MRFGRRASARVSLLFLCPVVLSCATAEELTDVGERRDDGAGGESADEALDAAGPGDVAGWDDGGAPDAGPEAEAEAGDDGARDELGSDLPADDAGRDDAGPEDGSPDDAPVEDAAIDEASAPDDAPGGDDAAPVTWPSNACTAGSQSRSGCGNARVISRTAAATGFVADDDTCSAGDRHEGDCGGIWDMGNDHTYAVFLRAGESLDLDLAWAGSRCSGEDWQSRLKVKWNPSVDAAGATSCPALLGCWAGPYAGAAWTLSQRVTASVDGWAFVIVDGGSTGLTEYRGHYRLTVTLSGCAVAGCACS